MIVNSRYYLGWCCDEVDRLMRMDGDE